jgi:hypothetical protein
MPRLGALAFAGALVASPVPPPPVAGPTHDELLRCYFLTHPAPPGRRDSFEIRRSRARFA